MTIYLTAAFGLFILTAVTLVIWYGALVVAVILAITLAIIIALAVAIWGWIDAVTSGLFRKRQGRFG